MKIWESYAGGRKNQDSYVRGSASLSGAPGLLDWESQLEGMCYTASITTVKLFINLLIHYL